jgi:hypothetical protein
MERREPDRKEKSGCAGTRVLTHSASVKNETRDKLREMKLHFSRKHTFASTA